MRLVQVHARRGAPIPASSMTTSCASVGNREPGVPLGQIAEDFGISEICCGTGFVRPPSRPARSGRDQGADDARKLSRRVQLLEQENEFRHPLLAD